MNERARPGIVGLWAAILVGAALCGSLWKPRLWGMIGEELREAWWVWRRWPHGPDGG